MSLVFEFDLSRFEDVTGYTAPGSEPVDIEINAQGAIGISGLPDRLQVPIDKVLLIASMQEYPSVYRIRAYRELRESGQKLAVSILMLLDDYRREPFDTLWKLGFYDEVTIRLALLCLLKTGMNNIRWSERITEFGHGLSTYQSDYEKSVDQVIASIVKKGDFRGKDIFDSYTMWLLKEAEREADAIWNATEDFTASDRQWYWLRATGTIIDQYLKIMADVSRPRSLTGDVGYKRLQEQQQKICTAIGATSSWTKIENYNQHDLQQLSIRCFIENVEEMYS